MGSGELTLSHHFDTSIARLKTLAPQPETEGIAVTVPDPKSGDAVSKVTRDTEKAVDDMSISWLDASAKWKTDDPKIKKNKVYYLELSFYVKGHSIPENAKFTVNGKEPCAEPKISYKDGIAIIRCAYQFTFGTPKEYRVTFDTEYGESPEEMTVTEGTILRYVQQPLMEDIEGYHFGGWRTYSNDEWDSIEISDETTEWGEITFCAMWVEYIDDIQISFSIPAVGQTWEMPSIAKNANYHLEETAVQNSNYDRIEKITGKETLTLSFKVVPNSKAYALSTGDNKYRGTLTVKGVSVDYSYTDFEDNLNVSCIFTPLDNNVTALQKGGSFEMADKVIRSSKSDKSLNGSSRSPLKLRVSKKTKKSLKLTWKKADGAKTYVIYGARKGKKMTKIATVKKNSYNVKKIGKKLSKGKKYKFIVVARDGNEVVSTSATVLAKTKK
jgi:hypothetical protein